MTDRTDTGFGPGRSAISRDTVVFNDLFQLEARDRSIGWDTRYRQLGKGPIQVYSSLILLGDLAILLEKYDRAMQVTGGHDTEVVSFALVLNGPVYWRGYTTDENTLIMLNGGNDIELHARHELTLVIVYLPRKRLCEYARTVTVADVSNRFGSDYIQLDPVTGSRLRQALSPALAVLNDI